jgi:hypothetical protein
MNWLKNTIERALQWLGFLPATNDKLYEGLHIGPNTYYLRQNLDGMAPRLITLGRDCVLAPTAMILTHDASSVIHTGKHRFAPVKIGDRCFLGYNSVIMPGVTIGDDVIVGAGAVVTRDVPAGAVVGGVPAHVIGNTADVMKKWENQLVEPPYSFGVCPTPNHLLEIQERALTRCGHENRSGTNP